MHNSIGVKQCLMMRGIQVEAYCLHCHTEAESILHALQDCPASKRIWQQLGRQVTDPFFSIQNLQEWLSSNAKSGQQHSSGPVPWFQVFLFAIWMIWKDRNQLVFRNKSLNPNLDKAILDRAMEFVFCACNQPAAKRMILKSTRWEKLNEGWLTLNTDGSETGSDGLAKGGGLIRDGNGTWLIGFARKIRTATSFLVELWALRDGLRLCLQIQAQAVYIELDAKAIVDALHSQSCTNTVIYSIMEDCRHLVTQIPQTRVKHVYREANRCADFLAKLGTGLQNDFAIFSSPPVDLLSILEDDVCGFSVNRLCPVVLVDV